MTNRKSVKAASILAFAFATNSSLLMPAVAANENNKSQSSMQKMLASKVSKNVAKQSSVSQLIAHSAVSTSDSRAFYLLSLANDYMNTLDKEVVEKKYRRLIDCPVGIWSKPDEEVMLEWVRSVCAPDLISTSRKNNFNAALATKAIREALPNIEKSCDTVQRLHNYLVASVLFRRLGLNAESEKCALTLEQVFQKCEQSKAVSDEEVRGAWSVLNTMAYFKIPIAISEQENRHRRIPPAFTYSNADFVAAEKLRLRAVKMTDGFDAHAQLRRRAHRDLSLWYGELGMKAKADAEKNVVYHLVGVRYDGILYPSVAYCGDPPVWWVPPEKMKPVMRFGGGVNTFCR